VEDEGGMYKEDKEIKGVLLRERGQIMLLIIIIKNNNIIILLYIQFIYITAIFFISFHIIVLI
jgi:hypothetical protein